MVLICSTSEGSLSIVDTHAISSELKGQCRNGVVVHGLNAATALARTTNWLFARIFGSAAMVEDELAILIPEHSIPIDCGRSSNNKQAITVSGDTPNPSQTHRVRRWSGPCPPTLPAHVGW